MFAFGPKQVAFTTNMNFGLVLPYSHMRLSSLCTSAILQSQWKLESAAACKSLQLPVLKFVFKKILILHWKL